MVEASTIEPKSKKERSPSFPFIPLKKAVERTKTLLENHKREAARVSSIAASWEYGLKSSGLLQTIAALKQFGLIEDLGSGDERKVQVSELGRRILTDERPGAREAALKTAAIKPRLIAEYLDRWLGERPSDSHCISELELDRGFSRDAATLFLKVFDETVSYASLSSNDKLSPSLKSTDGGTNPTQVAETNAELPSAPIPRDIGSRPFQDRLKVQIAGNSLGVVATLVNAAEVDKLIKVLEANKSLLEILSPSSDGAEETPR